jgi:ankyrin repeat protein
MKTILYLLFIALFSFTATLGCGRKDISVSDISASNVEFTSIFEAAEKGTADDIRSFLVQGIGVNEKDNDGNTPLHWAAQRNPDAETVKFLIFRDAEVNAKNNNGRTPFDLASDTKKEEFLREAGGRSGQSNNVATNNVAMPAHTMPAQVTTPTQVIAVDVPSSQPVVMPQPVATSPSPQAATPEYIPPQRNIFEAAKEGTVRDIEFFANNNPQSINFTNDDGDTLLHIAAVSNSVEVVKYLVEGKGINVNMRNNKNQDMPLHKAAAGGNLAVVKYLIERGAPVDAKNAVDFMPLQVAANSDRANSIDVLKYLLEKGADVNSGVEVSVHAGLFGPRVRAGTPLDVASGPDREEKRAILRAAGGQSTFVNTPDGPQSPTPRPASYGGYSPVPMPPR